MIYYTYTRRHEQYMPPVPAIRCLRTPLKLFSPVALFSLTWSLMFLALSHRPQLHCVEIAFQTFA